MKPLNIVERALETVTREHQDMVLPVDGVLPAGLDGVLYRNGPGRLERGGERYGHLFDGDGHVCRFAFRGGEVHYTNRFVRTRWYEEEEAAGRMLYRGFGTNLPGGLRRNLLDMRFKNAANTSVIVHGGELWALWEGGLPHRLDPETLETLGPHDFGGRLRNRGPDARLSPVLPFSAHPSVDAMSGELFNFGMSYGLRSRLLTYRVDARGTMDPPRSVTLGELSFVHDFALTARHLVFLLPRAIFDVPRTLLGMVTPAGSLELDTVQPMQALLVPRDGGIPRRIPTCSGFVFHVGQGFEREDGVLIIDAVRFEAFPPLDSAKALYERPNRRFLPHLVRLELDPTTLESRTHVWHGRSAELPTVAAGPGPKRFVYSVGAPADREELFFTSLQKLDTVDGRWISTDFGEDLVGEPLFVAHPHGEAEDDGWLLSLVYRAAEHRTDLLVLDAADLTVRATARLPHHVHPGFHGCFVGSRAASKA